MQSHQNIMDRSKSKPTEVVVRNPSISDPVWVLKYWNRVRINADRDRAITNLLFELGGLSDIVEKSFRRGVQLKNPLRLLEMMCCCIKPEYYNLEVDALILNLLRHIDIADLLKPRYKAPFRESYDRQKEKHANRGIHVRSELDAVTALKYYREEKNKDIYAIVDKRFASLFCITLKIFVWRDQRFWETCCAPVRRRTFRSHHIVLDKLPIESDGLDQLKRQFLQQVYMVRLWRKTGYKRWGRAPLTKAGKVYTSYVRILPSNFIRRKHPPSMSPCEISQILEKMSRNILSLRHSYIREWTPEVAQAAALSQVLFSPIYQAEGCDFCVGGYTSQAVGGCWNDSDLRGLLYAFTPSALRSALRIIMELFLSHYDEPSIEEGLSALFWECGMGKFGMRSLKCFSVPRKLAILQGLCEGMPKCAKADMVQQHLAQERAWYYDLGNDWDEGRFRRDQGDWFLKKASAQELRDYFMLAQHLTVDCLDHGVLLCRLFASKNDKKYRRQVLRLASDVDSCIVIVRALSKLGGKDINRGLWGLLTYLGANVRKSRRSKYMPLYKEVWKYLG
jgi:hypothetical protein